MRSIQKPPTRPTRFFLARGLCVAFAVAISVGLAHGQDPAPRDAGDERQLVEAIRRQDAEIEWLRARLAEIERDAARDRSVRGLDPQLQPAGYAGPSTGAQNVASSSAYNDILSRLEALEQNPPKGSAEKKAGGDKKGAEKKDGWTDLSGEKWTVRVGGHVQADYILWANASPTIEAIPPPGGAQNYFEFRRLRLTADGTGYGVYDFRLQLTLEPETVGDNTPPATSPDVKDAYFSINELPWLGRVRIGNFFIPFSLEQVTNDTNNIFLERSIPSQDVFSANREVGIAMYNCTDNQRLSWATGIFIDGISDSLKERIDDNQGYRMSGRVNWLPYYDEPTNGRYLIHTGAGILYTKDQDNSARFRARPQIHEGPRLIDSLAIPADSFTTGNLEFAAVYGRFAVQSEAFLCQINRINNSAVNINGTYIHFSYFLTGENRMYERFGQHGAQFARNAPFSNVFAVPGAWSLGAWEAKARWSHLDLNSLSRGQYNDVTVGFNWYWSDRTRVMFDWIHPFTSSEVVSGGNAIGATQADILGMRFDFNW